MGESIHELHRATTDGPSTKKDTNYTGKQDDYELERRKTGYRTIGILKLRGKTDDLPQSWWFASTAIPLVAATIGPLANVLSIAALVSKWRTELANNGQLPEGTDASGVDIDDPTWEIICNACSLAFGFIGNFFLLLNFTKRVRYIMALPMTIICWFLATGLLMGITICMHLYAPAVGPGQTYSQGFWHAVIASVLYMIGSVTLMINMLGYFMGKYPQHFDLDDDQRTLILQTMMFFFWLAGGAAVFQAVAGFSYSDALYFCDVTVLTVGFGDFVSPNDAGRGLVFPYSVIGIIFLGLMINSIRKFAISTSQDKIVRKHELNATASVYGRTVTNETELRDRLGLPPRPSGEARRSSGTSLKQIQTQQSSIGEYGRVQIKGRAITFHEFRQPVRAGGRGGVGRTATHTPTKALSRDEKLRHHAELGTKTQRRVDRRQKLLLLKEEKDRFEAMRAVQADTKRFRQYYGLFMSVVAFGILWCVGAVVFMVAEQREQQLSYFQALYFCCVSLLTIGYGDFSPKSNAGKAFFVIWSLVAIPTMTILVSDMGDTVITAINRGTFTLADWTIMPKKGVWAAILRDHPRIHAWLKNLQLRRESKERIKRGFTVEDPDVEAGVSRTGPSVGPQMKTLEELASEAISDHQLARKLALAIKRVAADLGADKPKKYSYEEWVEFTRLIRFSAKSKAEVELEEEEEGLVEWDWIGEDSPMLSDVGESQWVLDRLCESLNRYTRQQSRQSRIDSATLQVPGRVRNRNHPHLARVSTTGDRISEDEDSYGQGPGDSREDEAASEKETGRHRSESDAVRTWEARVKAEREERRRLEGGEGKME